MTNRKTSAQYRNGGLRMFFEQREKRNPSPQPKEILQMLANMATIIVVTVSASALVLAFMISLSYLQHFHALWLFPIMLSSSGMIQLIFLSAVFVLLFFVSPIGIPIFIRMAYVEKSFDFRWSKGLKIDKKECVCNNIILFHNALIIILLIAVLLFVWYKIIFLTINFYQPLLLLVMALIVLACVVLIGNVVKWNYIVDYWGSLAGFFCSAVASLILIMLFYFHSEIYHYLSAEKGSNLRIYFSLIVLALVLLAVGLSTFGWWVGGQIISPPKKNKTSHFIILGATLSFVLFGGLIFVSHLLFLPLFAMREAGMGGKDYHFTELDSRLYSVFGKKHVIEACLVSQSEADFYVIKKLSYCNDSQISSVPAIVILPKKYVQTVQVY